MKHNKTILYLSILLFLSKSYSASADIVACSTNQKFSEYSCDICYSGGDAQVDGNSILLPESLLPWENKLDGINQNFYKSSQKPIEIETDIGTKPTSWDGKGVEWGEDVIWEKLGGTDMYTVGTGTNLDIRKITKDTKISLENIKLNTNNYFLLKMPFKYKEIKSGTFDESETKTTNYCVSYAPKKVAGTTTTPATTTPTAKPPVTTPTTPTTNPTTNTTTPTTPTTTTPPQTTPVTTPKPATETPETIESTPKNEIPEKLIARDPKEMEKETSEEIPTYNAKVSLDAAPADPNIVAATHVETGPEDMVIIVAALLLSVLLYPKLNTIFH